MIAIRRPKIVRKQFSQILDDESGKEGAAAESYEGPRRRRIRFGKQIPQDRAGRHPANPVGGDLWKYKPEGGP